MTAENQSVTGHLWVMCLRCSAADLLVFSKRFTRAHKVREVRASFAMDATRLRVTLDARLVDGTGVEPGLPL